ncbi:MAG: hypothetical protein JSR62_10170 [Nitrospira sp.]|nr:hypothetical protein [Nitrospira sp.]
MTSVARETASHRTQQPAHCSRCGGWMVEERCMDIGESLGGYWFWGQRCIQCGDIVDEVILRNRRLPVPHPVLVEQEAQPGAGAIVRAA